MSEAIVECWGSSLDNVYQKKHNTYDPVDHLDTAGTVDMLVFIRLNGPIPSMAHNSEMLKSALISMKGPDYGKYFTHNISKVVGRLMIIKPNTVGLLVMCCLGGDSNTIKCVCHRQLVLINEYFLIC